MNTHPHNECEWPKLASRYEIKCVLGKGGFGVVYLGCDQKLLGKEVVIKVLQPSKEEDWVRKKFKLELEALARINHPSIVSVTDAGQLPNGQLYLVMEFVKGATLREVLNAGSLSLARIGHLVRQIGNALSAAHENGVYHRDLKPENIMLQVLSGGEEMVKLIDFGIATVIDSQLTHNHALTKVVGTVPYMAPEQLRGLPEASSDIYALGVIAYEMVTGRLPFEAESFHQHYRLQEACAFTKPSELQHALPAAAEAAILQALSFEPNRRQPRARDFGESFAHVLALPEPVQPEIRPAVMGMRVVLFYKRQSQPDEQVLNLLESSLRAQGHQVFVDRHLTIGIEWAKEIEQQIRSADIVIPLLSAASVTSEMVAYEVQTAHEAAQQQAGKPRLLPVRIDFNAPLPESLAGILDAIQHVHWHGPKDNALLLAQLMRGFATTTELLTNLQRRKLEQVGGAVPLTSEFYIVRPTDNDFLEAISRRDSIVLVKGARQMGKTSLLARGLQRARDEGAKVVFTDFQMLNAAHLVSAETLFLALAESVAEQLDLDIVPEEKWDARRGPSPNFERFLRREVLPQLGGAPLVWGLDEVDRLFTCTFGSEVFGLFRSWHNARALNPAAPWRQLTLAIAYATEAHLFITDMNQSPFNVGTRLEVRDFDLEQVAQLNRHYGNPLQSATELERFYRVLSGHPYLVRRGLHELATQPTDLTEFEALADRDEGPFGDHLRRILVLLAQDEGLCNVVKAILSGLAVTDTRSFYRLRSAGVMTGETVQEMRPRCRLYAMYLMRHLL
ncbi:MAG: AAA-like domain-containing protein [Acidobacteria bacterium]|nr:AAA-like domain-containing protein [Acidobacteriota bacterium]MBI3424159.1 AAA-like domain-containing protein [Acidobacteriota bacterium]